MREVEERKSRRDKRKMDINKKKIWWRSKKKKIKCETIDLASGKRSRWSGQKIGKRIVRKEKRRRGEGGEESKGKEGEGEGNGK